MSSKNFILQNFDEDSPLLPLSIRVADIIQAWQNMKEKYKIYYFPFFGRSEYFGFVMKLTANSIFLDTQKHYLGSPMQETIPTKNAFSTPQKENANVSTLQRNSCLSDNAAGKVSQIPNTSLEKQATPAKIIPSTSNWESVPQERISFDTADKETSKADSGNWKKRLLFQGNRNATELGSFQHGFKELNDSKSVDSEACTLFQQQTNIVNPKVDNSILSPITKADKKVTSSYTPEQAKWKPVRSPEINITANFTKKTGICESPLRKNKVVSPDPIDNSCPTDPALSFLSSGSVETDNPSEPTGNPCSTMSAISLTDGKSAPIIKRRAEKKKSPKDISVSENISKPQCSRNLFSSEENSSTCFSPIQVKSKDHLSDKPSKEILPKSPCDYVPPPSSESLMFIINRLTYVILTKEAGLQSMFETLLNFRNDVEFVYNQVREIVEIAHCISLEYKDKDAEEMQFSILEMIQTTSHLLTELGSFKLDLDIDIRYWILCSQKIRKIRSHYEPLSPLVSITVLQEYEAQLRDKWKSFDQMLIIIDKKRQYFFSTFEKVHQSFKLFSNCICEAGIIIEC